MNKELQKKNFQKVFPDESDFISMSACTRFLALAKSFFFASFRILSASSRLFIIVHLEAFKAK